MPDLDTLKQHEQAFADLERDEQKIADRVILTREGPTGWAIELEGDVSMMSVPTLLRLVANLAEKAVLG